MPTKNPEIQRRGYLAYVRRKGVQIVSHMRWCRRLKQAYGLTEDQYYDMWVEQDGLCGICGELPKGTSIKLSVDHDHTTGKVRGLLCRMCNYVLGIRENEAWDSQMRAYLGRRL